MEQSKPAFKKYLFVCENVREKGKDCCGEAGSDLRESLKKAVEKKGLSEKIRVSRTGCLDVCSEGPNVLLMPDNLWFKRVGEKDLETILEKAVEGLK